MNLVVDKTIKTTGLFTFDQCVVNWEEYTDVCMINPFRQGTLPTLNEATLLK